MLKGVKILLHPLNTARRKVTGIKMVSNPNGRVKRKKKLPCSKFYPINKLIGLIRHLISSTPRGRQFLLTSWPSLQDITIMRYEAYEYMASLGWERAIKYERDTAKIYLSRLKTNGLMDTEGRKRSSLMTLILMC